MSGELRDVPVRLYTDERGTLGVADPPFEIKRVFWLTKCTLPRGGSHVNDCDYLMIALRGSFGVYVGKGQAFGGGWSPTDGRLLNTPDIAVWVPAGHVVKVVEFSEDALCLVLADGEYKG